MTKMGLPEHTKLYLAIGLSTILAILFVTIVGFSSYFIYYKNTRKSTLKKWDMNEVKSQKNVNLMASFSDMDGGQYM